MSYQVLARKWRPRSFQEMVGQAHVVRALTNALEQNRLHHAYLFTGTRGVGKTTLARILAKCLNCEEGIQATPCGQCTACQEIDAGRFLDLLEVDAASRTKVEDTRELLDNVQYAPTKGRYKIYLIDEVHMLSGHSFNALLKTLEEPPPHVKFLLATTDPQRLPITVLSRCLQFHLKNLPQEQIYHQLCHILDQEQIAYEASALQPLARAADGSLRDALSLLDQAIAYGNGRVQGAEVSAMLGTTTPDLLLDLLNALIADQPNTLLTIIGQMAETAVDFANALEELLSLLHQLALLQAVPDLPTDQWNHSEQKAALAARLGAEELQLYYQIGLIGRRDLPLAPTPRSGFEMVLLRMLAFRPQSAGISTPPPETARTSKPIPQPAAAVTVAPAAITTPVVSSQPDWPQLLSQLNLRGSSLALASHCALVKLTDQEMHLLLDSQQAPLLNKTLQDRLTAAIQNYFKKPMQVFITTGKSTQATPAALNKLEQEQKQADAVKTITNDSNVKTIISRFNAKIVPDSIDTME